MADCVRRRETEADTQAESMHGELLIRVPLSQLSLESWKYMAVCDYM